MLPPGATTPHGLYVVITPASKKLPVRTPTATQVAPPAPKLPFHVDIDRPLPEILAEAVAGIEQQYLRKALKKTRGNVGQCAKISGLSRRSITAKIAEYKLDKSKFKEV